MAIICIRRGTPKNPTRASSQLIQDIRHLLRRRRRAVKSGGGCVAWDARQRQGARSRATGRARLEAQFCERSHVRSVQSETNGLFAVFEGASPFPRECAPAGSDGAPRPTACLSDSDLYPIFGGG